MEHSMTETKDKEKEGTPFDEILDRVRSYIENLELVTKETLQELLSELEDLQSVMDNEEDEGDEEEDKGNSHERPSLGMLIGKRSKNGGKHE